MKQYISTAFREREEHKDMQRNKNRKFSSFFSVSLSFPNDHPKFDRNRGKENQSKNKPFPDEIDARNHFDLHNLRGKTPKKKKKFMNQRIEAYSIRDRSKKSINSINKHSKRKTQSILDSVQKRAKIRSRSQGIQTS